jgi:hypothetical protein
MYELERLGLTDIKVVEPALAEYSLYHYLNKKHETIIKKITLQLEKMESNGMIEKIRKEYIKKPLSR